MGYHEIEFYVILSRITSLTTVEMNEKPSDTVVFLSLHMRLLWQTKWILCLFVGLGMRNNRVAIACIGSVRFLRFSLYGKWDLLLFLLGIL